MDWLEGEPLVEGHPFRNIRAQPAGPGVPEVWVLGSSDYGARVAAHFGLPYCFAHFITDGEGAAQALDIYRDSYKPSERHPQPVPAVTVWAMAAETQDEAEVLYSSRAIWRLGRDRGVYSALPSPAEAAAYQPTPSEQAHMERSRERALYGTAEAVVGRLEALARQLDVAEVAVLTTVHDAEARRRSYTLLMQALRQQVGSAAELAAG